MGDTVTIEIPQDILDSARLTAPELKLELAIWLYFQSRLSAGKARELAGLSLWEFRQVVAARHITTHYEIDDFHDDVATVSKLRHLRL